MNLYMPEGTPVKSEICSNVGYERLSRVTVKSTPVDIEYVKESVDSIMAGAVVKP